MGPIRTRSPPSALVRESAAAPEVFNGGRTQGLIDRNEGAELVAVAIPGLRQYLQTVTVLVASAWIGGPLYLTNK